MIRRLLTLLLALAGLAAADPSAAWAQGRPAEAVAPLIATATATGRWDAWCDAGLAAAVADRPGPAIACLLRAHRLAPEQPAPVQALRALGVPLPTTWSERAGPLGRPGQGWPAVVLLAGAGLLAGLAIARPRCRPWGIGLALALVVIVLPGWLAIHLDAGRPYEATVRDTQALDSTGAPRQALPAGTLLLRQPAEPWAGRILVLLPDASPAYVVAADLIP